MTKFLAAVLTQINQPLEIDEVEAGNPGVGQVLVKVLRSGICGAQIQEISGNKGNAAFIPHLLGHEGYGLVQFIGPGVKTVKSGDLVVMHWRQSEGIDSEFPSYTFRGREIKSGKVTTFQEFSLVSENRLSPLTGEIDPTLGALLGCALSTSLACVEKFVKAGDRVAIIGAGGVGGSLTLSMKMKWPKLIHVFDVKNEKKDWILGLGAHEFSTGLDDLTQPYDVIFDTTGNTNAIGIAVTKLAGSGKLVLLGQPKPGNTVEIPRGNDLFGGEGKKIIATQGGGFNPSRDLDRFISFCLDSKMPYGELVTSTIALDNVNEGIESIRLGYSGRVMIDLQNSGA